QDPNFEKGGQEEGVPVKTSEELPEVIDESDAPAEGTFIVIAGTFANYENATRRLQALMTMGYNDALIVKQARNGLFAVWANRVDDKSAAFDTVRKLAAQQINAYVRKR
ncbi:MAG: SPOR domain-containing protein, partial [Bacteroidetes bacterium]